MSKRWLLAFVLSLTSLTVGATETGSFVAKYSLARGGVELGEVTDTFQKSGDRYSLVSESRVTGPLSLVWKGVIHLDSQGVIAENTLVPSRYRRIRSDNPKKNDTVEFDWKARQLNITHSSRTYQEPLAKGTQDNLSQLYSFLYLPSLPARLEVPIANGKDVDVYKYNQFPSAPLITPAGKFEVVEYRRDAALGDKAVSVWISLNSPHIPVQVRVVDDGARMEQKLTSFKLTN